MGIKFKKGFALLVAVIFVSVVLALGTALGSLGYKQQILALNGGRSQYAFYAADGALECALLEAQINGSRDPYAITNYPYNPASPKGIPTCSGFSTQSKYPIQQSCLNLSGGVCTRLRTQQRFEIGYPDPATQATSGNGSLCADIIVYENQNKPAGTTYVFSQGYDVPCSKIGTTDRIVTRGLSAHF